VIACGSGGKGTGIASARVLNPLLIAFSRCVIRRSVVLAEAR
jgi:hypothetical protein